MSFMKKLQTTLQGCKLAGSEVTLYILTRNATLPMEPQLKILNVLLTGATGMVGEGVLHECLQNSKVGQVLVIGRRTCGLSHPKLTELLLPDLTGIAAYSDRLKGYNACFFCAGISSVGISKDEYFQKTYTLTLRFAEALFAVNPNLVFEHISGSGTDSSEKCSSAWARVKGKTENDLQKIGFKAVYNFRPGYMHPTPGLKNVPKAYKYFQWLYPVVRRLFPKFATTLQELALAQINAACFGFPKSVIEVPDIVKLAAAV